MININNNLCITNLDKDKKKIFFLAWQHEEIGFGTLQM